LHRALNIFEFHRNGGAFTLGPTLYPAPTARHAAPILDGKKSMNDVGIDWDSIFRSEPFRRLARKRRRTVIALGLLAAIYYFSIPALMSWMPEFFKFRLAAGINVGTLFAISQYPFGGFIVYAFLRRSATLDYAAATLLRSQPAIARQEKAGAF
jgi:uncharacterized membrane protein (DUF485 family)